MGWHSRGYLPHFDGSGMLQFITFRLEDAVPANLVTRWKAELNRGDDAPNEVERVRALHRCIERYSDSGMGDCLLADPRAAQIVRDALLHFDGIRYRLLAWTIMPNHVHVLIETGKNAAATATSDIQTIPDVHFYPLATLVHSWKSFTAKKINNALQRRGSVWMVDYFDRYIRDDEHYQKVLSYIHRNPVIAGLCDQPRDWPWSSAASSRR